MAASELAQELQSEVYHYRSRVFAESTKGTYRTYREAYFRFCELIDCAPIPATTYLICQYAAYLARTHKATSIRNYLGIINLLHKEFDLPNPIQDNWQVTSLLRGIKRVKGGEVAQKLPITTSILLGIKSKLNARHSFDASFWAVCLTAFYGLFWKSHLLPLSNGTFDPNKQFQFSDFRLFTWGVLLTVRWSKTIQFRERVVVIPLPRVPGSPLCLYQAIKQAFTFTHWAPRDYHAFSWLDHKSLQVQCFIYRAFLDKLRHCLNQLGYEAKSYAGHSFRRGGASFAIQAGIPVSLIKMLGDWKSDSVLLYLTVPLDIRLHTINQLSKHMISTVH